MTDWLKYFQPQHNTHIENASHRRIRVKVFHVKRGHDPVEMADLVIDFQRRVKVPTPHSQVIVAAFRLEEPNKYDAMFTDDSDMSFIVKDAGPFLTIVRSRYGTTWEEA